MKQFDHKKSKGALVFAAFMAAYATHAQTFTKITTGTPVTTPGDSRSVNWVDVDGDGHLDLFISNGKAGGQNNALFRNTVGGFTLVTSDPITNDGNPSDGATFADCDNDGDLDAVVVNWYLEDNMFYLNDGAGNFAQQTTQPMIASGGYSETASWGDYDNDGLVDLFVTRSGSTVNLRRNQLYHNDGGNNFTKILTGDPVLNTVRCRSVNWTDIDNDGDADLFVTVEGAGNNNELMYRNDGGGTFTRISTGELVTNGGSTMSSSWGDYDNDGDLDVYLCNDGANNALFRNDGNFNFTKITSDPVSLANSHSFSSAWSDIDNDGDLDLFVTNAFNPVAAPLNNFLYTNNGNGTFTKVEIGAPATDLSWSYGCAFGDYDNDGFEDLAVATTTFAGVDANDLLYHNDGNANHWITIKLVGTLANRSAIGAKIRVTATINGEEVTQMREISAQSGYCSQNDLRAHFGLGDAATITSITVDWPSTTADEVFTNVSNNQFITITEGQGLKVGSFETAPIDFRIYPNPANNILNIKAKDGRRITSARVFDLSGKLMLMQTGEGISQLDISKLATGSYMIQVISDRGTSQNRFVKN
ncbi:FG-GAP-like repeat-containing protein [Flavobacterium caeni]|uniref:Por secretion system C-terminal sorting domain-containing protein n=1 Tax=Flavobacterium caeni TaxID=490189 RepID=A0A1G5JQP9_9FLAO|nr:FG-GAP-like repeat-containing protein [Flavobacterium caeni]SCY90241.1 Por secretion system C-terminal sorting domain-containing protein [Flavobacterium caeni]